MKNKSPSVIIIGAGKLAWNLGMSLRSSGIRIVQIVSRSLTSSEILASKLECNAGTIYDKTFARADIFIISASDDSINEIVNTLDFGSNLVVHTAGSVDINVFSGRARFYGVLYPLQTFSKGRKSNFRNIPIFIEGNNSESLDKIRKLAEILSETVINSDSEMRSKVHLAAVFACNFVNYMYVLAEETIKDRDINFEFLKPLILETAFKAVEKGPAQSQTGPAIRGDKRILEKHMKMLEDKPAMLEIYKMLSENISYFCHNT